jgi:hypothetical protein
MPGQTCAMGKCGMTCAPPTMPCGAACVELGRDHENCGRCGNVCNDAETCVRGTCALKICGMGFGLPSAALVADNGANDIAVGDVDPMSPSMKSRLVVAGGASELDLLVTGDHGSFTRTALPAAGPVVSPLIVDFDDDKLVDVVEIDTGANQLVLLHDTAGTFKSAATVPLPGKGPFRAFSADFDGDRKPDVLVHEAGSGDALIVLNGGKNNFLAPQTVTSKHGVAGIAAGDLDGDGHPDLAILDGASSIAVVQNRGDGTFRMPVTFDAPFAARFIALGALSGSAIKLDIVVAGAGKLAVLQNGGNLLFSPKGGADLAAPPTTMLVGDANGDKIDDVVLGFDATVPAVTGAIVVLAGGGKGDVTRLGGYLRGVAVASLGLGDLDGDNKVDIAYGQTGHAAGVSFLRGLGVGATAGFTSPASFDSAKAVTTMAAGDLDGDGAAELVVASDDAYLWWNDGAGGFSKMDALGLGALTAVAIFDLDGDKKNDLIYSDGKVLGVMLNQGGKLGSAVTTMSYGSGPWIGFGDLDGDGKTDVARAGKDFFFFFKNGGGGKLVMPTSVAVPGAGEAAAVADFNADGWPDAALINSPTSFAVLVNKTRGVFAPPVKWPAGGGTNVQMAVADVNGDAKPDVLISNTFNGQGTITVVTNAGDATFNPGIDYPLGFGGTAFDSGDVDGDGRSDIVASVAGNDPFGVVVMRDSAGKLGPPLLFPSEPGARQPVLADVDGDGRRDVIVPSVGARFSVGILASACLP